LRIYGIFKQNCTVGMVVSQTDTTA